MPSTTATDLTCLHCGRPVIGTALWGASGPYHPECCQGPHASQTYMVPATSISPNPDVAAAIVNAISELNRHIEANRWSSCSEAKVDRTNLVNTLIKMGTGMKLDKE